MSPRTLPEESSKASGVPRSRRGERTHQNGSKPQGETADVGAVARWLPRSAKPLPVAAVGYTCLIDRHF